MGKSRQNVRGWKTSATRKRGGISSTSKPNVFEILVDEGQVSPFLNLPRELRDSIYEVILAGATISQQIEYNQQDDFEVGPSASEYLISSRPTLRNLNDAVRLSSMIVVSKQVSREFLEAVQRHIPVHLRYGTVDRGFWYTTRYIKRHIKVRAQDLVKRVPSTAHMSVNSTFYSYAHDRESFRSPDDLQRAFLEQDSFVNLGRLFTGCKQATHIAFHFTLHVRGADSHSSDDSGLLPESWKCKIIHNYLQTAIEAMPKLLRYSLVLKIWKPRNTLHQIRYAQRTADQDWESAKSTQAIFNLTRAFEARQYAKELTLLPEWRNLYEVLRFQHRAIPDFIMGGSEAENLDF
jgi:hypothetical protein